MQSIKTLSEMLYKTLTVKQSTTHPLVIEVTLSRPQVRNAFNEVLIAELTEVFLNLAGKEQVRAVVLKGENPAFCAGGDLAWMQKSVELDFEANLKETRKLSEMFKTLQFFPKPLLCVAQGAVIGGGVGLVSVCDQVIGVGSVVFSLSEVRLGIVPACIAPFVIRKIGPSHARELFLSAERFDAQKAHRIGLIHQIADSDLEATKLVSEQLDRWMECSPQALRKAKELVHRLTGNIEDEIEYVSNMLAELRVSREGQEGLKAFLEKRRPVW